MNMYEYGDTITDAYNVRICPHCKKEVHRNDMNYTKDCHGITYRLVCDKCYRILMENGYDGEYYDEYDECLDYDY